MLLRHAGLRLIRTLLVALPLLAVCAAPAAAQAPIFDQVHTIAAPTTGVPQEFTFAVSAAGTYTLTLTDLGAQLTPSAPLASVKLAVTSADALVGAPLVGAGSLILSSLAAGNYEIHVIGAPGTGPGSGLFGIQVVDSSSTQIATFQGTLALPSPALPNGEAVLDDSFTVQSGSGSACSPPQANQCYTISLHDLQLPQGQSLSTLTLLLIAQGGTTPVLTLPTSGATPNQATVPLAAGTTYRIFAAAQANNTVNAGLFGVVIAGNAGAVVYGRAVPVGRTQQLGNPTLSAGNAALQLTDLKFPAALAQLGAVLTLDGQVVAEVAGANQQNFTAVTQTYAAFGLGTAAAGSAGAYAVDITGLAAGFAVARGVSDAGSGLTSYAFDTALTAAGSYNASLADFLFPAALTSLQLAVAQNGALAGTPLGAAGTLAFNGAAGPLTLLAFAKSSASGGLFGIDIIPGAGGAAVFAVTQGAGGLFTSRQITITAAGSYKVTTADLGFPANFANYDTIVTQGTQPIGSIFGGGSFNFVATAGNYYVNVIAQTSGAGAAGTYALTIAPAPPPPAVTLSVDHPQIGSGGTVDLTWSTQSATSCVGTPSSGGWSGNLPLSGTVTSAALTATTTFTLTCTGPGGSQAQSVTVTVNVESGHGGGGATEADVVAILGALLLMRKARRRNCHATVTRHA